MPRLLNANVKLAPDELKAASQKSNSALHSMGPQIQWLESYVTDNKLYCVYIAPDDKAVKAHAQKSGFPADKISRAPSSVPTTAE